ncbi:MAG: ArgR family transcriptional regulator [Coriobacteriia bacterium]|nr:ArgR family transcriptional regulator [Coriobacteriia bacterium]
MKRRIERHDVIRSLVREQEIKTQHDLVRALQSKGFECTQTTVSRDINDLGLEKIAGGAYMLKEDLHLKRLAIDLILDVQSVNNFIVIKTSNGMAQGVAAGIDAAQLDDILGTIAGDDTILMITASDEQAMRSAQVLKNLSEKKESKAEEAS